MGKGSGSGRGRPPQEFEFTADGKRPEVLVDELLRFAVRTAVLQHGGNLKSAVERLALALQTTPSSIYRKLSPTGASTSQPHLNPERGRMAPEFINAVWLDLRDNRGVETHLTEFAAELDRFDRDTPGPSEPDRVSIDHALFAPLTDTGGAPTKPMARVRGWCALAWLEHHGPQLLEVLDETVDGECPPIVPKTFRGRLDGCIDDLLTMTSMPVGHGHLAAAALVGEIGEHAIERIALHVKESPAGWRTLPAATQALMFARRGELKRTRRAVEKKVYELLCDIHEQNYSCLYRARSFWEECADALPLPSSPDYDQDYDKIIDYLIERAVTRDADQQRGVVPERQSPSGCPVRERQTAAVVAYDRIMAWEEANHVSARWDVVEDLVEPLAEAAAGGEEFEAGLDFTAAFLVHRLRGGGDIYAKRPSGTDNHDSFWLERPEVAFVDQVLKGRAADDSRHLVPVGAREATLQLVGACALSVSGIVRRRLLEALMTAGLGPAAQRMFVHIAKEGVSAPRVRGEDLRFVVENCVFSAGFVGDPESVEPLLDLALPDRLIPHNRAVAMTALMGIGDLAYSFRSEDRYELLRTTVIDRITQRALGGDTVEGVTLHLALPELRAALHVFAMMRVGGDDVFKFLEAVVGGGVTYAGRDGELTTRPDPRSVQLALWCAERIVRMEKVKVAPDATAVPGWLVSPLPREHRIWQSGGMTQKELKELAR